MSAIFVLGRRNGNISNDVDKVSKFLLDGLQIPYYKMLTCHNDNHVLKLLVEKKYGDAPSTTFTMV